MKSNALKHDWINKYRAVGHDRFFKFLLSYGNDRLLKMQQNSSLGTSPEIEFIEYAEHFLVLYRRSGEADYFTLAAIFRRAAHKIYRTGLKQKIIKQNKKFLQLVTK